VEMGLAATGPGEALCVSGSLYTVSEARAFLFQKLKCSLQKIN